MFAWTNSVTLPRQFQPGMYALLKNNYCSLCSPQVLLLHFAVRLTPTRSVQTAINALGDLSDSRTPSVSVPHELYRALVSDERLRGNVDSQSDDKWASASTTVMAKPAVGAKGGATDQLRLARNSDSGPGLPKERRSASAAERWRNVSTEQHTQADLFNAGIDLASKLVCFSVGPWPLASEKWWCSSWSWPLSNLVLWPFAPFRPWGFRYFSVLRFLHLSRVVNGLFSKQA